MTALIATVAPGRAWLSTDTLWTIHGKTRPVCPKFDVRHQGHVAVAGTGDAIVLALFSRWLEERTWAEAVDQAEQMLQVAAGGVEVTALLLRPGDGWCFDFGDGFVPHRIRPGGHTCRPSFGDIPGIERLAEACRKAAERAEDVEEFHLNYLQAAAAASRAGKITWKGEPRPIGGKAWCCRMTEAGAEVVELGSL